MHRVAQGQSTSNRFLFNQTRTRASENKDSKRPHFAKMKLTGNQESFPISSKQLKLIRTIQLHQSKGANSSYNPRTDILLRRVREQIEPNCIQNKNTRDLINIQKANHTLVTFFMGVAFKEFDVSTPERRQLNSRRFIDILEIFKEFGINYQQGVRGHRKLLREEPLEPFYDANSEHSNRSSYEVAEYCNYDSLMNNEDILPPIHYLPDVMKHFGLFEHGNANDRLRLTKTLTSNRNISINESNPDLCQVYKFEGEDCDLETRVRGFSGIQLENRQQFIKELAKIGFRSTISTSSMPHLGAALTAGEEGRPSVSDEEAKEELSENESDFEVASESNETIPEALIPVTFQQPEPTNQDVEVERALEPLFSKLTELKTKFQPERTVDTIILAQEARIGVNFTRVRESQQKRTFDVADIEGLHEVFQILLNQSRTIEVNLNDDIWLQPSLLNNCFRLICDQKRALVRELFVNSDLINVLKEATIQFFKENYGDYVQPDSPEGKQLRQLFMMVLGILQLAGRGFNEHKGFADVFNREDGPSYNMNIEIELFERNIPLRLCAQTSENNRLKMLTLIKACREFADQVRNPDFRNSLEFLLQLCPDEDIESHTVPINHWLSAIMDIKLLLTKDELPSGLFDTYLERLSRFVDDDSVKEFLIRSRPIAQGISSQLAQIVRDVFQNYQQRESPIDNYLNDVFHVFDELEHEEYRNYLPVLRQYCERMRFKYNQDPNVFIVELLKEFDALRQESIDDYNSSDIETKMAFFEESAVNTLVANVHLPNLSEFLAYRFYRRNTLACALLEAAIDHPIFPNRYLFSLFDRLLMLQADIDKALSPTVLKLTGNNDHNLMTLAIERRQWRVALYAYLRSSECRELEKYVFEPLNQELTHLYVATLNEEDQTQLLDNSDRKLFLQTFIMGSMLVEADRYHPEDTPLDLPVDKFEPSAVLMGYLNYLRINAGDLVQDQQSLMQFGLDDLLTFPVDDTDARLYPFLEILGENPELSWFPICYPKYIDRICWMIAKNLRSKVVNNEDVQNCFHFIDLLSHPTLYHHVSNNNCSSSSRHLVNIDNVTFKTFITQRIFYDFSNDDQTLLSQLTDYQNFYNHQLLTFIKQGILRLPTTLDIKVKIAKIVLNCNDFQNQDTQGIFISLIQEMLPIAQTEGFGPLVNFGLIFERMVHYTALQAPRLREFNDNNLTRVNDVLVSLAISNTPMDVRQQCLSQLMTIVENVNHTGHELKKLTTQVTIRERLLRSGETFEAFKPDLCWSLTGQGNQSIPEFTSRIALLRAQYDELIQEIQNYSTLAITDNIAQQFEQAIQTQDPVAIVKSLIHGFIESSDQTIIPYPNQILTFLVAITHGAFDHRLIGKVGTGQGKSILIAMMAVYLAVKYKCRIDVVTTNQMLAVRDKQAFTAFFETMGVPEASVRSVPEPIQSVENVGIFYGDMIAIQKYVADQVNAPNRINDANIDLGQFVRRVVVDEVDELLIGSAHNNLKTRNQVLDLTQNLRFFFDEIAGQNVDSETNIPEGIENSPIYYQAHLLEKRFMNHRYRHFYKGLIKARNNIDFSTETNSYLLLDDQRIMTRGADDIFREAEADEAVQVFLKRLLTDIEEYPSLHNFDTSKMAIVDAYKQIIGFTAYLGKEAQIDYLKRFDIEYFNTPQNMGVVTERLQIFSNREKWLVAIKTETLSRVFTQEESHSTPVLIQCNSIDEARSIQNYFRVALQGKEHSWKMDFIRVLEGSMEEEAKNEMIRSIGQKRSHARGIFGNITIGTNISHRGIDPKITDEDIIVNGGLTTIDTRLNLDARDTTQKKGRSGRNGQPGNFLRFYFQGDIEKTFGPYFRRPGDSIERNSDGTEKPPRELTERIQTYYRNPSESTLCEDLQNAYVEREFKETGDNKSQEAANTQLREFRHHLISHLLSIFDDLRPYYRAIFLWWTVIGSYLRNVMTKRDSIQKQLAWDGLRDLLTKFTLDPDYSKYSLECSHESHGSGPNWGNIFGARTEPAKGELFRILCADIVEQLRTMKLSDHLDIFYIFEDPDPADDSEEAPLSGSSVPPDPDPDDNAY